jgi:hypothetical protein
MTGLHCNWITLVPNEEELPCKCRQEDHAMKEAGEKRGPTKWRCDVIGAKISSLHLKTNLINVETNLNIEFHHFRYMWRRAFFFLVRYTGNLTFGYFSIDVTNMASTWSVPSPSMPRFTSEVCEGSTYQLIKCILPTLYHMRGLGGQK